MYRPDRSGQILRVLPDKLCGEGNPPDNRQHQRYQVKVLQTSLSHTYFTIVSSFTADLIGQFMRLVFRHRLIDPRDHFMTVCTGL